MESKLITYIDQKNNFTVHIFDGRKALSDLAISHFLNGQALESFRLSFLSLIPISHFLKKGENFSLSINSAEPFFKLNLEMNSLGNFRALLLPENFSNFPKKIQGKVQLVKNYLSTGKSYTSIIEIKDCSMEEIVNKIFQDSYQVNSEVFVSPYADISFMLCKLPDINLNYKTLSINEYFLQIKRSLFEISKMPDIDWENILQDSYEFLNAKDIRFVCPCTKERFIQNLLLVDKNELDHLFQSEQHLEIQCDYCKKKHLIQRSEVDPSSNIH